MMLVANAGGEGNWPKRAGGRKTEERASCADALLHLTSLSALRQIPASAVTPGGWRLRC
jgi:hypothetical protein